MNNIETLKSVIIKYELEEPVPPEIRKAMERSRKNNLVKILKQDARRTIYVSLVVSFFLGIKKFGISVSIVNSAIAVSAALIIVAGAITAAGVYTTAKITGYLAENKTVTGTKETPAAAENNKAEEEQQQEILSYSVAVQPVDMDDTADRTLAEYRNIMISKLQNLKGSKAAIKQEKLNEYNISEKTMTISIIKLEEKSGNDSIYRLSAKIISTENSRVLMYTSETAAGEKSIPDTIRKLAEKISSKL